MSWHAKLDIRYTLEQDKTVARYEHDGPLRILQSLYPEGPATCHNIIVHPPGGLVGGDTLDIQVEVGVGAHGLITTPGATRFYKSLGEPALQRTRAAVHANARLEWLPLESIAYCACRAENHATFKLAPGAEMIGWDITALGLPHAKLPFEAGSFMQHIEIPGVWLERGRIDAADERLLNSPLGLAGHKCMASVFFATGSALSRDRKEHALNVARAVLDAHPLKHTAGATCPNDQVVVVRVLAPWVEPAMAVLRQVWAAWRQELWQIKATAPRIWAM
ncbi:MAG: urease accessory protein UreD [Burkholderiaceae bacterium]|nr:urease accessory protein UreD [Burkholderiaceae bacterium]